MATGRGLELCHDVYFVPLCNITPFPMAKKSELLLSSKTSGLKNWRKLFSFVKILLALRGGKDFRSLSGEPSKRPRQASFASRKALWVWFISNGSFTQLLQGDWRILLSHCEVAITDWNSSDRSVAFQCSWVVSVLNVINKLTILIPIHCLLVFLLQRLQKLLSSLLEIG